MAEKRASKAKLSEANTLPGLEFQTPPERIMLREGSWDDPTLFDWSEVDVAFAYSTAFPAGTSSFPRRDWMLNFTFASGMRSEG